MVRHVNIRVFTTAVFDDISSLCHFEQIPFTVWRIFGQVGLATKYAKKQKLAGVGPGAEFQIASLIIERKIRNINLAHGLDESWGVPLDAAIVVQNDFGVKLVHVYPVNMIM